MKKYSMIFGIIVFTLIFFTNARSSTNDFFSRDPNAVYDESFPNIDLVTEIPGYKLDPSNSLAIPKEKKVKHINLDILEKAQRYIIYSKLNHDDHYYLYTVIDLGNYVLLYFYEDFVKDGGFELIYSKELKKIIGSFSVGYKG